MFSIKIIPPNEIGNKDAEDTTVSEAIETIYSKAGRMVIINWNEFAIPVFGSSIGDLFYNIISILKSIKAHRSEFTESFLDSNFTAKWFIRREDENIEIKAEWISIPYLPKEDITLAELQKVSNIVVISLKKFIAEWVNLLKIVKTDLVAAGYNNDLEDFKVLEDFCNQ